MAGDNADFYHSPLIYFNFFSRLKFWGKTKNNCDSNEDTLSSKKKRTPKHANIIWRTWVEWEHCNKTVIHKDTLIWSQNDKALPTKKIYVTKPEFFGTVVFTWGQ
jgi:hypothetical protein